MHISDAFLESKNQRYNRFSKRWKIVVVWKRRDNKKGFCWFVWNVIKESIALFYCWYIFIPIVPILLILIYCCIKFWNLSFLESITQFTRNMWRICVTYRYIQMRKIINSKKFWKVKLLFYVSELLMCVCLWPVRFHYNSNRHLFWYSAFRSHMCVIGASLFRSSIVVFFL